MGLFKRLFNGHAECKLPDKVQAALDTINSDADEIQELLRGRDEKLLRGALGSPVVIPLRRT